jgi:hypothetical protein
MRFLFLGWLLPVPAMFSDFILASEIEHLLEDAIQ